MSRTIYIYSATNAFSTYIITTLALFFDQETQRPSRKSLDSYIVAIHTIMNLRATEVYM